MPWPLGLAAAVAAGWAAVSVAQVLDHPVLGWAMGRRPRLAASGRVPPWDFAVDVGGQVLIYPIVDGAATYGRLDRLQAWCLAHDLDPGNVVVPQTAVIRDGWLTLELHRVDAAGNKYVDPADHTRAARETVRVRLMDNPPDCWVRREVSRGSA